MVKAAATSVQKKKVALKALDSCSSFDAQVNLFKSLYLDGLTPDQQLQVKVSMDIEHPVLGKFKSCLFSLKSDSQLDLEAAEQGTVSYHKEQADEDRFSRSQDHEDIKENQHPVLNRVTSCLGPPN